MAPMDPREKICSSSRQPCAFIESFSFDVGKWWLHVSLPAPEQASLVLPSKRFIIIIELTPFYNFDFHRAEGAFHALSPPRKDLCPHR